MAYSSNMVAVFKISWKPNALLKERDYDILSTATLTWLGTVVAAVEHGPKGENSDSGVFCNVSVAWLFGIWRWLRRYVFVYADAIRDFMIKARRRLELGIFVYPFLNVWWPKSITRWNNSVMKIRWLLKCLSDIIQERS